MVEDDGHTFARFLRHSVQALGVTTPKPRRLLDGAEAEMDALGALGVSTVVEEEESAAWTGPVAVEAGVPADGLVVAGGAPLEVAVGVEVVTEFGREAGSVGL